MLENSLAHFSTFYFDKMMPGLTELVTLLFFYEPGQFLVACFLDGSCKKLTIGKKSFYNVKAYHCGAIQRYITNALKLDSKQLHQNYQSSCNCRMVFLAAGCQNVIILHTLIYRWMEILILQLKDENFILQ